MKTLVGAILLIVILLAAIIYFYYAPFVPEDSEIKTPEVVTTPLPYCTPNEISINRYGVELCKCLTFLSWSEEGMICKEVK